MDSLKQRLTNSDKSSSKNAFVLPSRCAAHNVAGIQLDQG